MIPDIEIPIKCCYLYDKPYQPENTTQGHQQILMSLADGADLIFEFGTFKGRTVVNWLANTHATIFTLDIEEREFEYLDRVRKIGEEEINDDYKCQTYIYENRILTQFIYDSRKFVIGDWSELFDLVFVDACHDYPATINDIRKAIAMVKPGGKVAVHDYNPPHWAGVAQAIDELVAEGFQFYRVNHTEIALYTKPAIIAGKEKK